MKKIIGDPQFQEAEKTRSAFVIGANAQNEQLMAAARTIAGSGGGRVRLITSPATSLPRARRGISPTSEEILLSHERKN
jgi:hypothetical protein